MFDSILDALGVAGSALSAPGDYLRGALAGRLGERASGRDLLGSLGLDPGDGFGGQLAGFGTEVLTDPLTYLGGAAGRLIGGRASKAAEAMGPGYRTGGQDLARMMTEFEASQPELSLTVDSVGQRLKTIFDSPNADRILGELPPESKILGGGAEGVGFLTPQGDVLRLGKVAQGAPGRPVAEGVAQATRAVDIPTGVKDLIYRAERVPLAEHVDDVRYMHSPAGPGMPTRMQQLDESLGRSGLQLIDDHSGNVGMIGGKPVVIDPGAYLTEGYSGAFQQPTQAAEPGALMRALLGVLGGQGQTRRAIEAGLPGPDMRNQLTLLGGGLGSVGGIYGRASSGGY